jgi:ATP-dependent Clp protease ATP-binding subunit ClpX
MTEKTQTCSFCGKAQEDVEKLVVNDTAAICSTCISLCSSILVKDPKKLTKAQDIILDPKIVKSFLDEYVVGQEDAKKILSVAVINHYKRILYSNKTSVEIDKANILILGPSGSGKTILAKTVARYLDVPVIIADATTLTEAGYVGDDVSVLIEKLYHESGGDISKTEKGIIFIDEIDKIGKKNAGSSGRDVSGEGVQQALLKLVEGKKVTLLVGPHQAIDIDTKNILFIASGAFSGLDKVIKARKKDSAIGFNGKPKVNQDETLFPTSEDLIAFGMIPELLGRFSVMTSTLTLTASEMKSILTEPKNNIIDQLKFFFECDEVDLYFSDDALNCIVEHSLKKKLGARGLRSIIESVLNPFMFNISDYKTQKTIVITKNDVETAVVNLQH